jgi:hypothetical protein
MSYRHLLGGIPVEEPNDWDSFDMELSRDFDARTLSVKYPGQAKFSGGGYARLRQLFTTNLCSTTTYEVFEECAGTSYQVVKATIILADCEWNLNRCEVDVSLVDDGIGARIKNNRRIPIRPGAEVTKNAVPAEGAPEILVDMFYPQDPLATYISPRRMYDWLDAMRHAVRYITDGQVTVESDWYVNLPDHERFAITTGYQIRTASGGGNGLVLEYSFEDLFFELAKKYDLWMYLTRTFDGDPVLNIAPADDLFTSTVAIQTLWQDNLVQSIETSRIYAKVLVGSENGLANVGGGGQSLPYLILQGFSEEEFHFEGECNTDAELDLVNKWEIDTNIIERQLTSTQSDTAKFIIQYDRSTMKATKGDYFDAGGEPYLYNEALLNLNVLNRYALPSNVAVYFDATQAEFLAERSAAVVNTPVTASTPGGLFTNPTPSDTPSQFDVDYGGPWIDPGNNYGNGTAQGSPVSAANSLYTAPAQGWYTFEVNRLWSITSNIYPPPPTGGEPCYKDGRSLILVVRRNSLGGFISQQFIESAPEIAVGDYTHNALWSMNLDPGDRVNVVMGFKTVFNTGQFGCPPGFPPYSITVTDRTGSTYGTTFVATGGGQVTSIDPNAARIVKYAWEQHIPAAVWASLVNDPRQAIAVSPDASSIRTGHILEISRKMKDGQAQVQTITDRYQPL